MQFHITQLARKNSYVFTLFHTVDFIYRIYRLESLRTGMYALIFLEIVNVSNPKSEWTESRFFDFVLT